MAFTKKDKELYDKQLKIFQKEDPAISLILDIDESDSDWIKNILNMRKRKKK